jgi:hypothetical protein
MVQPAMSSHHQMGGCPLHRQSFAPLNQMITQGGTQSEKKIQRQYGLWDSPNKLPKRWRKAYHSQMWNGIRAAPGWLENRDNRGVIVVQPADGNAPRR